MPTKPRSGSTVRRFTINLRQQDVDRLEKLAEALDLSANDIVRRALATEEFIVEETKEHNRKLIAEDPDGTQRRVEILNP